MLLFGIQNPVFKTLNADPNTKYADPQPYRYYLFSFLTTKDPEPKLDPDSNP
jgi:hypothetical protein